MQWLASICHIYRDKAEEIKDIIKTINELSKSFIDCLDIN